MGARGWQGHQQSFRGSESMQGVGYNYLMEMPHTSEAPGRIQRFVPVLLFAMTLGLYLATLTQVHTFDALSYVTSVERKPWTAVFHPHHLGYGPLGALALALGRGLGLASGAALPMQVINALAGAIGVALFYRVLLWVSGRMDVALAVTPLLAGSYAYWYYAVEIEVYTVATLFLISCLAIMVQPGAPTPGRMALLAVAQVGAVLFHQTNVLLSLPVLAWYLANRRSQRTDSVWAGLLVYGLVLGLGIVLPYLWVGFGVSGFRTLDAFVTWMTEYARTGWWGGPLTTNTWARLAKGLTETIAASAGGWIGLALVGVGLVSAGLRTWRTGQQPEQPAERLRDWRPLILALGVWLLVYGGFFAWWEPDNIEFWIASLPAALLLLALALRSTRRWGPGVIVVLGLALVVLGINAEAIRRRGDAATDLQRLVARTLAEQSTPADLLIVPDGLQELYLPYYQQRENFISLNQAIFDANSDWDAACAAIQQRIEAARYAGATALIADEALKPPALLLARHRLSQAQVDDCFARYVLELLPLQLPAQVPGYARLPFAGELAEGPGWRFQESQLGWQAANVSQQRFGPGWSFVPGSDASLTSPLLQIDTSRYRAITIQLANRTQSRDAQLFLIGPDGRADEARSIQWTLQAGAELHSYTLELQGLAGWQGVVTRLRLDPVGVGDGGEIEVRFVGLVR